MALAANEPDVIVADEDQLPFADSSFDLVVSAGALTTVNDLPAALAGIGRVLPQGKAYRWLPLDYSQALSDADKRQPDSKR